MDVPEDAPSHPHEDICAFCCVAIIYAHVLDPLWNQPHLFQQKTERPERPKQLDCMQLGSVNTKK
jgi:hypothetical protein